MGNRSPDAGRKKGTRNKRTIERERMMAAAEAAAKSGVIDPAILAGSPRNLPKDVLVKLMDFFMGRATREQQRGAAGNEAKLIEYLKLGGLFAKEAAPFFHPKYSAVMVQQQPAQVDRRVTVHLHIGDRTETIVNEEDGSQLKYIEDRRAVRN